ncbi:MULTISPECIES: YveK family protein [Pontibacillus]|uniref:Wzz/FepE/Etk N-terminal domain-containing protein n=1 Tax=Pontibacillus chungwhensis TaxID=265426 RepID=A0ABY8V1T6_9BACI|nr:MULTISPECIES: Wzz/FepE/Etk N-terminal domain-containing protein [Pontibacillus]MCD5324117.1 Wzz/FepE/Etk N-terminal domain-containing protein [Pontibacillus sp. HN14]WIF97826.1 Wzz/FepE/Etk N-terminal domain-containing protein [Pontibacillus chungwhensis]
MEETISLKEIFDVLKKRIVLILSLIVLATVVSGVVSYFVLTPIYESSARFAVSEKTQEPSEYNYSTIQTNVGMIATYNDLLKDPYILDYVIDELDLNVTASELTNKISLSSGAESQVVKVTVTDPSIEQAVNIANKTVESFEKRIPDVFEVNNVKPLAAAEVPKNPSPVKPSPMLNIAIAFVLGAMVGVGLAFLLEYLDNTIKDEQDIDKTLGLPVLGVISEVKDEDVGPARTTRSHSRSSSRSDSLGA